MSSILIVLKSFSVLVLLFGLLTQAGTLPRHPQSPAYLQPSPAPAFERRQIGNLQCNINRVQIITSLAQLDSAVQDLSTDVASYDHPPHWPIYR